MCRERYEIGKKSLQRYGIMRAPIPEKSHNWVRMWLPPVICNDKQFAQHTGVTKQKSGTNRQRRVRIEEYIYYI